jgi:hypothetical protein
LFHTANRQRKEFPEAPGKYTEVHFPGGSREKPGGSRVWAEVGRNWLSLFCRPIHPPLGTCIDPFSNGYPMGAPHPPALFATTCGPSGREAAREICRPGGQQRTGAWLREQWRLGAQCLKPGSGDGLAARGCRPRPIAAQEVEATAWVECGDDDLAFFRAGRRSHRASSSGRRRPGPLIP